jgi:DNA-directed RNA polymerase subunit M/transcription elongation factor TFIIS
MSFSFGFTFIPCPLCGEMIMPTETQVGKEPDLLTAKCDYCKNTIEVRRDPVTGKLIAKKSRPS